MKKSYVTIWLMFLLSMAVVLTSCSEGNSEPQYVFKKASQQGVAAQVGDIKVTYAELEKGIESDIYEAEKKLFDLKFNKLQSALLNKLVAADPSAKGMGTEEFIEKNIINKINVSEKDISGFIKEKNIPAQHINDAVRERIKNFLRMEKKTEHISKWMAKKTKGKEVEVFLTKPRRPLFNVAVGKAPTWGSKSAKVTIVEYSDFQCPFCAKGADIITKIKSEYAGKVRIAFKHFPLPFHKDAKGAAMASMCVYEQDKDKFWKYHDKLFKNQANLKTKGLTDMAKELGIDIKKFAVCLDQKAYQGFVEQDMEEGKKVGVKSTPTFFVNGMLINGAQPFEVFQGLIEEELKK